MSYKKKSSSIPVGDSMPPGLAKTIYEQAKQQSQQTGTQTNQTSKSNGGTDKGQ